MKNTPYPYSLKHLLRSFGWKAIFSAFGLFAAMTPFSVHAQVCNNLYSATVTTAGNTGQVCVSSLKSLYETAIRDLEGRFPNYTGTEQVLTNASLNGVPASLSFATGSPILQLAIPLLNISETFAGATREASARLLHDWLKNQESARSALYRYQAQNVANNPFSSPGGILWTTVANDFDSSLGEAATYSAANQANSAGSNASLIGVGVVLARHTVGGQGVTSLGVPLSYTVRNDIDPRRQAMLRGGIGVVDRAGTQSYSGRVSGAYRFPLSDQWALTPSFGVAMAGSNDAAYAVGVIHTSVTSTYLLEGNGFDVVFGNMLGYYKTVKPPFGQFAVNPNLSETALRNGVLVSQPVTISGKKMSVEYTASDTRYFGTSIYQRNSQELGISLGTNKSAYTSRSFFRANLAYQRAKDTHGVMLTVNYWF
jgi:hypothetical protein